MLFPLNENLISNEKYTYDAKGNWITYNYYETDSDGNTRKVKTKRRIEYW